LLLNYTRKPAGPGIKSRKLAEDAIN